MFSSKNIGLISRFLLAAFIFLGLISFFETADAQVAQEDILASVETKTSVDVQDAALSSVLKVFSDQSGLNFVASAGVKDEKITLYLVDVSIKEAIDVICKANGLMYERLGNNASSIFLLKESGKPKVEMTTRVYTLNYASAGTAKETKEGKEVTIPGLEEVLNKLISSEGEIVVDPRTNSLIVTDYIGSFETIDSIVAQLDTKTQQVMIEAEVLETGSNLLKDLGFEWGRDGRMFEIWGASRQTNWPLGKGLTSKAPALFYGTSPYSITETGASLASTTVPGAMMGIVSFYQLRVALDALEQDETTKILARPKILTLNNKPAEIRITEQTAVAAVTTLASGQAVTTATSGAERIETGIILKVTPQINKDDFVTMTIEPSVTNPVMSVFFPGLYVDPHTRAAKTTVMVKDGDTIVLGGLMSTDDDKIMRKVPILGDVPLLGLAFRQEERTKRDRELIVFITPKIVKEVEMAMAVPSPEFMSWEPAPSLSPVEAPVSKSAAKTAAQKTRSEAEAISRDRVIEETIMKLEETY